MSLGANAFIPQDLERLREAARRCRCMDIPSCDACRLIATCDYLTGVALKNKEASEKGVKGILQSDYNGDAGYNADWSLGLADGTYVDVIELLRSLEGKSVRLLIEEVDT
jgi:hypothetical protein